MSIADDIKRMLTEYKDTIHSGNNEKAAEALGVSPPTLWRWITKGTLPKIETLIPVFEALNAKITLPREPDKHADMSKDTVRDVCFIDAKIVPAGDRLQKPHVENYIAVPMVGEVGAGHGLLSQEEFKSWILVYNAHTSVRTRSNLIAVEIAQNQVSMEPTLSPNDIVLVDRNDWGHYFYNPPGNIFLVREPGQEGGAMVKRVSVSGEGEMQTITFYSDNKNYPPETYHMHQFEHDYRQAIVGRIVWAWSDLTRK